MAQLLKFSFIPGLGDTKQIMSLIIFLISF